jgi:hypothetical protein
MEWRELVEGLLQRGKGFEVFYKGAEVEVVEAEGAPKAKVKLGELRRYAGRKVIGRELREVALSLAERLVEAKVPFKVTVGSGDFVVRFDLDRYVRVHGEGSSVVGFKDLSEAPVASIADLLRRHGPVKLLSPVR